MLDISNVHIFSPKHQDSSSVKIHAVYTAQNTFQLQ